MKKIIMSQIIYLTQTFVFFVFLKICKIIMLLKNYLKDIKYTFYWERNRAKEEAYACVCDSEEKFA